MQVESVSPQLSIDRLSVTFADESLRSEIPSRLFFYPSASSIDDIMQFPPAPPATPNVIGKEKKIDNQESLSKIDQKFADLLLIILVL